MTAPKSLAAYADVVPILEAILGTGGTYQLENKRRAQAFMNRCVAYRTKLRETTVSGQTKFDRIKISHDPSLPGRLIFEVSHHSNWGGELRLPDGTRIEPGEPDPANLNPGINTRMLTDRAGTQLDLPFPDMEGSVTDRDMESLAARLLSGHGPFGEDQS